MAEKILGAQLYTVRDHTQTEPDFERTMERVAELGYKSVQLSCCHNISPQCVKRACDATGLKVDFTHIGFDEIADNPEKTVEDHAVFGCRDIGIGGGPGDMRTVEEYEAIFRRLERTMKVYKENGVHLLYHNHSKEFERVVDGKWGMQLLCENLDPDVFAFTFDIYWGVFAGVDPADFIRRFGKNIRALHLKDMKVLKGGPIMSEVLEGNINFDAVMAEVDKTDIKYFEVELDTPRIDPFDSLKISHDNLKARYDFI